MTAVTPASRQTSTPSANGKNASEAHAAPRALVTGLLDREAGALDAAHLAGTDAHQGAVASQHDGIRLDVRDDAPGKVQVSDFCARPGSASDDLPVGRIVRRDIGVGDQHRSTGAAQLERDVRRPQDGRVLKQAQVGLGREDCRAPLRRTPLPPPPRERGSSARWPARHRPCRARPPHHRRRSPDRSARARSQAVSRSSASAAPQGLPCLTMTTAWPSQVTRHGGHGSGVEQVVVRERLALQERHPGRERPARGIGTRRRS